MAPKATAASTPEGVVRVGEFVHYHGTLTPFVGQIMQIKAVGDGLTLETATGGRLRRVRTSSVSPCGPGCRRCAH